MWSAVGCSFDPAVEPVLYCETSDDCRAGRQCVDGRCSDDASPVADVGDATAQQGDVDPDCVVDRDGDGFRFGPGCPPEELDCDDNDPDVYPGAPTRCNGRDNDCDGEVDRDRCECTDGLVSPCGLSVGACEPGTRTCADGVWGVCTGGVEPVPEECNGIDDDCDSTIDEGCPCEIGESKPCGLDVGACSSGVQTCVDGVWSACEGAVEPTIELCNGIDDDCDGVTDNSPDDVGAPCTAAATGACAVGTEVCRGGGVSCEPATPTTEMCNGIDDDCDGAIDEGLVQPCNGACGAGFQTCESGAWGACRAGDPPPELCNGIDDDCDGSIDESFPEAGMSCDTGQAGVCAAGEATCTGGTLGCRRLVDPSAEVCDGLDNDCDGDVDEDPDGLVLAEACGGACPAAAVKLCLDGAWSPCEIRDVELCNGTDDTCDGVADNISACYVRCGTEAVVGTRDCAAGTCTLPGEICGDGIDNDCDGLVDQNCDSSLDDMVYVPGGTFRMGAPANSTGAAADEQPIHTVELSAYYIDRYEVSREQYGNCVLAGSCSVLEFGCPLQLTSRDRPVTCVTWDQADSYCAWVNKRLPTEAEWEKAARGPFDRQVLWPWGDVPDSSRAQMDCSGTLNQCVVAVKSMPAGASYYGVHHMAGNAAEWVADYYDADFYTAAYTVQPFNDVSAGDGRVLRGGGWSQDLEFGRVANRAVADFVDRVERGFRCAK